MKGIIFASDARLKYAGENLQKKGHAIRIIQKAEQISDEMISEKEIYDFVMLPIRGTKDGSIVLKDQTIDLKVFLERLPKETLLLSGVPSEYQEGLTCRYFCYQKDSVFAEANSDLTAEGVLYMVLGQTPDSLFACTYDIIGTGRTGQAIRKIWDRLGLKYRMITSSRKEGCISFEEWYRMQPADIVINTAPAPVITEAYAQKFTAEITIIDIASGAVGAETAVKEMKQINYLAAPPLPGIVTPKAAGDLIAQMILRVFG